MQILDDKGRIFGKINLFDLCILILLIVGLTWGVGRFTGNQDAHSVETQEIEVQLFIHDVRNVTTEIIQVGDRVRDYKTNQFWGEIIDKEVMPAKKLVETEDGTIVQAVMPEKYDVLLTLKGQGVVTEEEITIGQRVVRLGMPMAIRTNSYEVTTTVFGIDY
ncbi:MAG: DUF4330 domain-containing protein [Clostridiaceae bacterium]|nr:DUF4330 domain-containing protein [Clostridiaceae bacterium]